MKDLEGQREKIDLIDDKIIRLIVERMKIIGKISKIKEHSKLEIRDIKRENQIKRKWIKRAKAKGANEKLSLKVISLLLEESIAKQKKQ